MTENKFREWWIFESDGYDYDCVIKAKFVKDPDEGFVNVIEAAPALAEIKRLEQLLAEARAILSFYSDGSKYQHSGHDPYHIPVAIEDHGAKARAFLNKYEEPK